MNNVKARINTPNSYARNDGVDVDNVNDAPSITSTGGTAVDEDALYSYSITTADDDSDTHTSKQEKHKDQV